MTGDALPDYAIRNSLPGDWAELASRIAGADFKSILWQWQYHRAAQRPVQCIRAIGPAGETLGFNGLMPIQLRFGNCLEPAIWSCDFYVEPESRGKGLGGLIKQELAGHEPLALALGISAAAGAVHRRQGWVPGHPAVLTFARQRHVNTLGDMLRALMGLGLRWIGAAARYLPAQVTVHPIGDAIPDLARIWSEHASGYPAAVERDEDYLRWRYADCPAGDYQAMLLQERQGTALAGLVFRRGNSQTVLCDYIGPGAALPTQIQLVRKFVETCKTDLKLSCATSLRRFQLALLANGMLPSPYSPLGFNIRAPHGHPVHGRKWFLMSGDSDGEFLAAAADGPPVDISRMSGDEFAGCRDDWNRLVAASGADPLFMDWHWMHEWWRTFAGPGRLRLELIAARSRDGELVGLLPLCGVETPGKRAGSTYRLTSIGSLLASRSAMRTEYWQPLCLPGYERALAAGAIKQIADCDNVDELLVTDLKSGAPSALALASVARLGGYARPPRREAGYVISLEGGLAEYQRWLGSGSRRRLFGARNKAGPGLQFDTGLSIDQGLDALNRFHVMRWGQPAFEGPRLEFNRGCAQRALEQGRLQLSGLYLDGELVSVLYNICAGETEYNLQLGFNEGRSRELSLGYLHLGFAIEDSARRGMRFFDLLAGRGQRTNYKAAIAQQRREMSDLEVAFSMRRKLLLGARDLLKGIQ